MGLFCLFTCMLFGQNQKLSDSLIVVYESGSFSENELDLLGRIIKHGQDPEKLLEYSELMILKASKDSLFEYLRAGFLQKGKD